MFQELGLSPSLQHRFRLDVSELFLTLNSRDCIRDVLSKWEIVKSLFFLGLINFMPKLLVIMINFHVLWDYNLIGYMYLSPSQSCSEEEVVNLSHQ